MLCIAGSAGGLVGKGFESAEGQSVYQLLLE